MGTKHQPRRSDFQRTIDRQTRARLELMRRSQARTQQQVTDELIDAILGRPPVIPDLSLVTEHAGFDYRGRLRRAVDGIRGMLRDVWQAHR